MYIHQVPRGTELKFIFDDGREIVGVFDGNIDHMQFYVICLEISREIGMYEETQPKVEFVANDKTYSFEAKLLGISEKKDAIHDSLEFRVVTPFKEVKYNKVFKISIGMKVRLHEYIDDYKKMYSDGWICDAVSDSISKKSIRLWGDYAIDDPIGTTFTLEFSLKHGFFYMIPAVLVGNQINTSTRTYLYDYYFDFDFSQMPDREDKLIMEILEYRMRHRI